MKVNSTGRLACNIGALSDRLCALAALHSPLSTFESIAEVTLSLYGAGDGALQIEPSPNLADVTSHAI
jgi:hypothetical protein